MQVFLLFCLTTIAQASVTLLDPSDYQDLAADAADNSLKAIYDIEPILYQTNAIVGPYYYSNSSSSAIDHTTLTVGGNDTSVLVITEGAQVNLSFVDVIKSGYSSNLYQASFYGLNAAINVANGSISYIGNANITTHNGAANVFAFGKETAVFLSDVDMYSSGPTSHGLYAAGNATIHASNIRHYSGGNRCSSFAGDNPAGYVHVTDALAHTAGIGSAVFYALGEVYGTNVVGVTENSPSLFSDGPQKAVFNNVDFTAGLLAGTVMFSSMNRAEGAYLSFNNSRLAVSGDEMPGLWFGNIIAEAHLYATEITTKSNILVTANSSQVTQEFSYFAGGEQNSAILPAVVSISVAESTLSGDLVAFNGSSISWQLSSYSNWTGYAFSAFGDSDFAISLDETSTWILTNDTLLQNFTNGDTTLGNILSGGHTIYYDSGSGPNAWLNGSTYSLEGGGFVKPL